MVVYVYITGAETFYFFTGFQNYARQKKIPSKKAFKKIIKY